ncbi:electron transport oxidoreductase, putative [Perkinsus marinus ATCC 50983]|uniref:Electron transport oxidoreductase, putative n=1 Tax=Perkinsus marinus (strain ATCC 50983 / TXsc) TaxID=423536 RepID=C5KT00_PERM5|nr:electron transport oxidoreductase, putative [Perkinsus marinus ATCC 50983]EER12350.1 electron transport oxidoreductase, putative [Perkinsus marinus ATCC 50983]|eukprot:XP_002780555.1 electron transport oxidoreductase, putative [Perkinsus marinus ATCC 50983]
MQCDTTTVSPELDAEEAAEDGSSLVVHKRSERRRDRALVRELESLRYVVKVKSVRIEEARKILEMEENKLSKLSRSELSKPQEVGEQQSRVESAWRLVTEHEYLRDLALLEVHRLESSALATREQSELGSMEASMTAAVAARKLQDELKRAHRDVQRERTKFEEEEAQQRLEAERNFTVAAEVRKAQVAVRKRLFDRQQAVRAKEAENDEIRRQMGEQAQARVLSLRRSLLASKARIKRRNDQRYAEELKKLSEFEEEKKELLEQGLNPYEVFRTRELEEKKAWDQLQAVELGRMRKEALRKKMQYEAKVKAAEVAERARERVLAAEFQRNVSGVADKERFGAFIAKHSIGGVSVLDPLGKAARIDGSKVTVCRDMSFGLGRASREVIEKAKAEVAAMERSVRMALKRVRAGRGSSDSSNAQVTVRRVGEKPEEALFSTLLVAEQRGGKLEKSSLCAAAAASQLHEELSVMIAGGPREAAEAAARLPGVKKVYHCNPDDAALEHPAADTFANAVVKLSKEMGASYVVAGNSSVMRDSLPRAAAVLDTQPITDVIKVLSNDTFKRPMYAGNVVATVKSTDPVKVLIFRPTAFEPAEAPQDAATTAAEIIKTEIDAATSSIKFLSEADKSTEKPMLQTAQVVVAGGRALKDEKTFDSVLDPLAEKLGAALGATRAAVDAGYCSNDLQIGQTGKVVAPQLYIAIGISGAIQHTAGIKDSKCIVAINKDAEAPIFHVADYGLVGDLYKIVPELTAKL